MRILIISLLLVCGCSESVIQSKDIKFMPTGAKNVNDLGNGWSTFELEMDGATRKFLFHREILNPYSSNPVGLETLTELSQK